MSPLLWALVVIALIIALTIELWADAINWLLRRLGFQGAGRLAPARREIAVVEREFTDSDRDESRHGKVHYQGALWDARCEPELSRTLRVGDRVKVERGDGLQLVVVRKESARLD